MQKEVPLNYEVYQPFRDYLSAAHPTGCPIGMAEPPGETYEFLFPFKLRQFYGKLLLRTDRKHVVVFSAHIADYAKLSCVSSPKTVLENEHQERTIGYVCARFCDSTSSKHSV